MTRPRRSSSASGSPPCATSATRCASRHRTQRPERHAPDRAGARAQRLRRGRVGAAVGERDRGAERVGRADQRADVAGVGDPPERERRVPLLPARQILAAVDADHARRVGGGRDLARSSGSTSSPARSRSTGSAVAASTASSPSTKKRPSLSRQRRSCSFRMSLRRSLSRGDDHGGTVLTNIFL